jgi:hypothetical protein
MAGRLLDRLLIPALRALLNSTPHVCCPAPCCIGRSLLRSPAVVGAFLREPSIICLALPPPRIRDLLLSSSLSCASHFGFCLSQFFLSRAQRILDSRCFSVIALDFGPGGFRISFDLALRET